MVDIVEQLCVKSLTTTGSDYNGEPVSFTLEQGKIYTTTVPDFTKDTITVFSKFWVYDVPKEHFVLKEK